MASVTRKVVPAPLLREKPDQQSWDWVAKSLWSSSQKCRINLLDTVLVEGDSISQWLFTSKRGKVMRKGEKHLSRDRVKAQFLRFAAAYPRNTDNYAAVFHYKESSKVFTAEELNTALLSPLDTVLAMQPYAHPRGGTSGYSNFRHEYSIYGGSNDVAPVNNTFKYCESLPGDGPQLVRSKDTRVNAALQEMAVSVVKFVEATRRVHVTKMVAEFCVDTQDVPWFMRTTTFLTVRRARPALRKRPSELVNAAALAAAGIKDDELPPADGLNLPKNFPANRRPVSPIKGADGVATQPRHLVDRKSPTKGKWTNLNRKKRRGKQGGDAAKKRRGRAGSSAASVASVDTQATPPLGATGRIPDNVLEGLVEEDAPHLKFMSGTTEETLGSTQRGGCVGDFCDIRLAPKITAAPGQNKAASRPTWTAAAARAQVAGTMAEDDPTAVSRVTEDSGRTYKVPFRMVVQARQEAYYVSLMLKRHKQGQRGEFISSGYYPEHTERIAQKFPASYYRQVSICESCFAVYQKIEVERNRSLSRRAAAQRQAARAERRAQQRGGTTARSTRSTASSLRGVLSASDGARPRNRHRAPRAPGIGLGLAATAPGPVAGLGRASSAGGLRDGNQTPRRAAMERANAALSALTLSDIAEVRSFVSPPPAVALVGTALMLLLTGVPLEWVECRRLMARGDRLMDMILDLDADRIPARRLRQLLPIIRNPVFHPDSVQLVCRAASYLSAWVLSIAQYGCLQHNIALEQPPATATGAAGNDTTPAGTASTPTLPPLGRATSAGSLPSSSLGTTAGSANAGSSSGYAAQLTFAQKLDRKRKQQARAQRRGRRRGGDDAATTDGSFTDTDEHGGWSTPWSSDGGGRKSTAGKRRSGKRRSGGKRRGGGKRGTGTKKREAWGLSGTGASRGMDETGRPSKASNAAAQAAARRAQAYHTKRLHENNTVDPTGPQSFADVPTEPGEPEIESRPKMFRCSDGKTTVPYQIIGAPDRLAGTVNFVVIQDFFDTFEGMQVLLRDFMKTTRSQFLLLNLPGQAFTDYDKGDKGLVLNNEFHAAKVEELLRNADRTLEFNTSSQGFHMLGIGNGGNVAACWGARYGNDRVPMLKSLVLVNAFAHVDKQLASILHSSANVFSCFPPSRPDLPVSYFTRFLFSEDYVKRVSMDLALSMYTAVTNPITLDGRLRITRGALHHTDLRKLLPTVRAPLVIMQCTEDVLISPSNVDALIEGRMARHVWSHEQKASASASWFGPRSIKRMREVLRKPDAALVLWIKTGHEVRMEAKNQFLKLLSSLSDPDAALQEAEAIAAGKSMPGVVAPTRIPAPPQFGVPDFRAGGDASAAAAAAAADAEHVPAKYARRRRAKNAKNAKSKRGRRDGGSDDDGKDGLPPRSPIRGQPQEPEDDASRKARLEETEASYAAAMAEHRASQARQAQQQQPTKEEEEQQQQGTAIAVPTTTTSQSHATAAPQEAERKVFDPRDDRETKSSEAAAPRAPTPPSPRTAARQILASGGMGPAHVPATAGSGSGSSRGAGDNADAVRARREKEEQELAMRLAMLQAEQEARRKQWAAEDAARAAAVEAASTRRRAQRDDEAAALQAEIDAQARDLLVQSTRAQAGAVAAEDDPRYDDAELVTPGMDSKEDADAVDADALAAVEGEQPAQQYVDLNAMFAEMEEEDRAVATQHKDQLAQYQRVKTQMEEAKQALLDQQMASRSAEQKRAQEAAIIHLQRVGRGYLGRRRFNEYKEHKEEMMYKDMVATRINAVVRGYMDRQKVKRLNALVLLEKQKGGAAREIQRVARGYMGRRRVTGMRRDIAARFVQRVYRGHLGRRYAELRREQRDRAETERAAATAIQATWRMKMQWQRYQELLILQLAAMQIQRVWRGWLGRRRAKRKREWESAAPGPERLKLGLKLIEGSKEAFERQRQEIDALHRAQERAEARVSEIYAGLKENEEELSTLERELSAVDQLDSDLRELTHDKRLLDDQVAKDEAEADALARAPASRGGGRGGRRRSSAAEALAAQRAADAYALEVAIHMKKAEREKKKLELEAEFAGVFAEIEKKKTELAKLEDNISGMEALRQRKDREFQRLQRNLTELLAEQKAELDALREKGVQLETATATSAAAAAATAAAAKEAEKRSQAMFQSTEELLKFQFMSMSLSYFSSLNMLSSLRDINADTTSRAVASSADTAAAAAAAAAAANIPSLKQMNLGAGEILDAATRRRKMEEAEKVRRVEEAKRALAQPFDEDVNKWNIHDVGRWLDTLTLGQYKRAFAEAAVDGEFLMELRAEDVADVLGVEHRLHVKKILAARDKLRPLTEEERRRKEQVEWERKAAEARGEAGLRDKLGNDHKNDGPEEGPPPAPTVFSMVRNNRMKRLRAALDAGFDLEAADEAGNTLLLVACQNVSRKAVELCVERGANINVQNRAGNTPLHYAMAYDPDGTLGEYLIDKGANDMLENKLGLSPYDGLQLE